MHVSIDPGAVTAVLLHDGWHEVQERSFRVAELSIPSGLDLFNKPSSAHIGTGFTLAEEGGGQLSGLLSSILAVRH